MLQKSSPLALGYNHIMGRPDFSLKYLTIGILFLDRDHSSYSAKSEEEEQALVVIQGRCNVSIEGEKPYEEVGERTSMLAGLPSAVYVPRRRQWSARAVSNTLSVAVVKAPARRDTIPALVRPDCLTVPSFGVDSWRRKASMIVAGNIDADRLLVGETYNVPGCWSSYPPHKHDTQNAGGEEWYEEIYHFAIEPRQGFGIQRVYSGRDDPSPVDQLLVVEDGDTVAITRGYHPVVAAGGYRLGYLWALAGETRRFGAWSRDPDHEWVTALE